MTRDFWCKRISPQCLQKVTQGLTQGRHHRKFTSNRPLVASSNQVLACPTALGELSSRRAKVPYVETLPLGMRLQALQREQQVGIYHQREGRDNVLKLKYASPDTHDFRKQSDNAQNCLSLQLYTYRSRSEVSAAPINRICGANVLSPRRLVSRLLF